MGTLPGDRTLKKEKQMNLLEALKSKKPFRRKAWGLDVHEDGWWDLDMVPEALADGSLYLEDLLAEDYEVKE